MIDKEFAKYLSAKFGTPLYAYDLDEVERRAQTLCAVLPTESVLVYSLKANPLPAIGAVLRACGCRGEISSAGELQAAIEAGFAPGHLLYSGPGKTREDLQRACAAGVRYFSCESWNDLARLTSAVRTCGTYAKVLLRLNPSTPPSAQLAMAGVQSHFGFTEDELVTRAAELRSLTSNIEMSGIHIYYGTQIHGVKALMSTMTNAIDAAERLADKLDLPCQILDIGGGFPWPYATQGAWTEVDDLQPALSVLSSQRKGTRSAQLWFESGRYLSASSGTLLATVLDVKTSQDGSKYVVLDAGINHLGGMSGLGRILRPMISIEPIRTIDVADVETVDIVGPLCSPLDCLARSINVPRLAPGDVVCVPNVGAYGLTASLVGFLSRVPPLEIVYRGWHYVHAYRLRMDHEQIV
jgi:diaminopimelate decarboxylase